AAQAERRYCRWEPRSVHRRRIVAAPAHRPDIDTCNACGKLFPRVRMRLCSACAMVEDNRFQLVRAYLDENDGATVPQIARETGVSVANVRAFQERGQLVEVAPGLDGGECTCGGVGERCTRCRMELAKKLRSMQDAMAADMRLREVGDRRERDGTEG